MRKAVKEASDVLGSKDVKSIARQLQRMGRRGDTMLAHITPREAAKLKREGGAGTRNPETGLLEFYDGFDIPFEDYGAGQMPLAVESYANYGGGGAENVPYTDFGGYEPAVSAGYGGVEPAVSADYGGFDVPSYDFGGYGGFDFGDQAPYVGYQTSFQPSGDVSGFVMPGVTPTQLPELTLAPYRTPTGEEILPPERPAGLGEETETTPQEKSALSSLLDKLSPGTLARLGLGLGGALMGQRQAAAARKEGAAAADALRAAYEKSAADVRALAQPLTTAGAAALGQAQQGVLDPARLQQLEAARAQLAQQAARTGGVGAIQSAEAMNRARMAALQAQQTAALQLLGPGNQLMSQAIARQLQGTTTAIGTRLQLEQQANQAMANLYGQLGRFIGG